MLFKLRMRTASSNRVPSSTGGQRTFRDSYINNSLSHLKNIKLISVGQLSAHSSSTETLWWALLFPVNQKFRKFRMGNEWKRHFLEFHSEILVVPLEVGLTFLKIGVTGKFRSIRPFLLGPSLSVPGNRIQQG